jgi:nitroreductase
MNLRPSSYRVKLSQWLHAFDQTICVLCSKSRVLSVLYYSLLNNAFRREQQAFIAGRRAYSISLKRPRGNMALLRRNIHRLEKGLLMRPRRIPFGRGYIGETVNAYLVAIGGGLNMDLEEIAWANDVLAEYFMVHSEIPEVAKLAPACCINREKNGVRVPYKRNLEMPCPVRFGDLFALSIRRRSVRWFLKKPVPRELMDQAFRVALQAPSACNRQPFEFRVIDEGDLVAKVVKLPPGTTGYEHNVPVVVVVVGQQRNYPKERDRHLIYVDSSLAVMSFILALETLGLASCCINWPDIETAEQKMASLLALEPDERPIMLLAIGYPDPEGMVACSTKKSLSHIRRYNVDDRARHLEEQS